MPLFALAFAWAAGATAVTDVDSLEQLWSGTRDSSEQVVVSNDLGINSWPESSERRVRAVVAPVALPWLGTHVLYFEEFLHDDPDELRRQLLVKLEPAEPPAHGVKARLYTFLRPRAWVHLHMRPSLLAKLTSSDVATSSTCDLFFRVRAINSGVPPSATVVWINRLISPVTSNSRYSSARTSTGIAAGFCAKSDGEVQEEIMGFNWFELNTTQLYTCRVDWTSNDHPQDLRPLLKLDVQDQGGHGRFVTPDGRKIEITLHSEDWPFAAERDSLILVVKDQGAAVPFATAWASVDEEDISLSLSWLRIRCGPAAPDTDELSAKAQRDAGHPVSVSPAVPVRRYPSTTPG